MTGRAYQIDSEVDPDAYPAPTDDRLNQPSNANQTARLPALMLGLLGLLLLWTLLNLRMSVPGFLFHHLTPFEVLECFAQPLLLWAITYCLLVAFAQRSPRFGASLTVALVNIVALAHILDVRCKQLFLQPLTWGMATDTLSEADVLYASLPMFLGDTFWKMALFSLLAMNLLPVGLQLMSATHALLDRSGTILFKAAQLAIPLTIGIALFASRHPSHLEEGVFVSKMLDPVRLNSPEWSALGTQQAEMCDSKAVATVEKSPFHGLAQGRNVVIFLGETWGYHDSSFGDPAADHTPHLRNLAEDYGTHLACRTQSGVSTKSIYGILTGRYSSPSMEIVESFPERLDSIASTLSNVGYQTRFVSTQRLTWQSIRSQFASMGFQTIYGNRELQEFATQHKRNIRQWDFAIDDEALLLPEALPELGNTPHLTVYYNANSHEPYFTPTSGPADETPRARYLRALRYTDEIFGRIVQQIEARGELERTLFVVVGDHGENFSQDEKWAHRGCAMTEREHLVPLVFAMPGADDEEISALKSRRVEDARNVDILPTILDLLGLPAKAPRQGSSLFLPDRNEPTYMNSWGGCEVAGLVEGSKKYVFDLTTRKAVAYDLTSDPDTKSPRTVTGPEKAALSRRLQACAQYNDRALRAHD